MIVLLLSLEEVDELLATPSRANIALRQYLARERSLERLLPDDNLPAAILLRGLELDADRRNYVVVARHYETAEAADRAWAEFGFDG